MFIVSFGGACGGTNAEADPCGMTNKNQTTASKDEIQDPSLRSG
jgi:hypothetical protein